MMKVQLRIALASIVLAALAAIVLLASSRAEAGTCCSAFNIAHGTGSPFPSNVLPAPTYVDVKVLAANTSQTQNIPAGASWVVFSADCNFWALMGAAAAVPLASTSTGGSPMLNPAAWQIFGMGTQITVVSITACNVTMSFYQ